MRNSTFLTVLPLAALVVLSAKCPAQSWVRAPVQDPPLRDTHRMCWDGSRVLMFSGYSASIAKRLPDTWAWDGSAWSQLAASGPTPSESHAMSQDPLGGALKFGGASDQGWLDDTWVFRSGSWSKLSPTATPRGRASHGMVLAGKKVLMFGGSERGVELNDTWHWDGQRWTQLNPQSSPAPRVGFGIAYDAKRDRVVIFGGRSNTSNAATETWEWDGSTWTQVHPTVNPPGRHSPGMAYVPEIERVVLFGGDAGGGVQHNDTWEWDGQTWTELKTSVSPEPRSALQMTYDPLRQQLVVFGGRDSKGDVPGTWLLSLARAEYASYGRGCAGAATPPALTAPAPPRIGKEFSFEVGNLKPQTGGFLVVGNSDKFWNSAPLPLDMTFFGMPGCSLLTNWLAEIPVFTLSGPTVVWKAAIPANPTLIGQEFYGQAWVLDATANLRGIATSNGGRGTIGNW